MLWVLKSRKLDRWQCEKDCTLAWKKEKENLRTESMIQVM